MGAGGGGSQGMNLEVWFPQPNEVTVFLESSFPDPDEERMYESMLFALFAARHIANGRGGFTYQGLAETLFSLDEREPLPEVRDALREVGDVTVGSPSVRGGRKGFTCTLRPEKRGFFKLHPHGFGMLGKGVDYYGPTSTLALLAWLLERRSADARYQLALGETAKMIGAAGVGGQITVTSQGHIAMQAAEAGWMHPDDLIPESEEVPEEVIEACRANEIEFGLLYGQSRVQLQEMLDADQVEGTMRVFPEHAIKRLCRFQVAVGADLIDEDSPMGKAIQLLEAAQETGDEKQIQGAYDYYDRQLAQLIDERGLMPVAEQLEEMLFTSDVDEAQLG